MFGTAITARPIYAFGAALVGCGGYFLVLFGTFTMLMATLNPALNFCLFAVPVLACGFFHHMITRNAAISQARRWMQILASAFGAPFLASYLIGFAFVIATGEGF